MTWTLIALAALLLLPAPPAPAAGTPPFQVISPEDPAHDLLPKTCGVCHKDDAPAFFVVAARSREALEQARQLLEGSRAPASATAARPSNPHAPIACLFCHVAEPQPGDPPEEMAFRTASAAAATSATQERLCRLCHPGGQRPHPRVLRTPPAAAALAGAGLPVRGAAPGCTTCHDMHGGDAGPAAVRPPYLAFAATSPESFPHGNQAACGACHAPPGAAGLKPVAPAALCAGCHPGEGLHPHPVGVPSSAQTYPMDFLQYPLDGQGRLTCATCHDHPCSGGPDPRNPSFLRGGPYGTITEFCQRCHPKAGKGALNPHRQVNDQGRVMTSVCVFCHRVVPEAPDGSDFRPKDLAYFYSPVELCLSCHEPTPHPNVNHLVEMSPAMAQKLRNYEARHRVRLPLDDQGRVVCTTCHNPHDKGVLRGQAALGAGEPKQWRIPAFAELCTPCHARHD
ncbi:MAG: hypothetical protein ACYDA8_09985 [Deferrisomatales bacterium]